MYISTVPNRDSPPAILLREGWREGKKTRQRTVANLSDWPQEKIETFRRLLRDEPLVSPHDLFTTQKTVPHGHVEAILEMIDRLKLDRLISAERCRCELRCETSWKSRTVKRKLWCAKGRAKVTDFCWSADFSQGLASFARVERSSIVN